MSVLNTFVNAVDKISDGRSANSRRPGQAGTRRRVHPRVEQLEVRRVMTGMSLDATGFNFIIMHESFRSNPYNDTGNNATIGYGHLIHHGPVNSGDAAVFKGGITKAQATQYLQSDVQIAVNAVNSKVKVPLTQNQFDALVDLTFRAGVGGLSISQALKDVNNGNYAAVPRDFTHFIKSNNKVDPGLINRAADEGKLFQNVSVSSVPDPYLETDAIDPTLGLDTGSGDQAPIDVAGNGGQVTIAGNNQVVDVESNQTVTTNGTNNTIIVLGTSVVLTDSGSNNELYVAGSQSHVTINSSSDTVGESGTNNLMTINGTNDDTIIQGTSAAIFEPGNGNGLWIYGNFNDAVVGGTQDAIIVQGSRTGLKVNGNFDDADIEGSNDSVAVPASRFGLKIGGDDDDADIEGSNDSVDVVGDRDGVKLGGSNNGAQIAGSHNAIAVPGRQNGVSLAGVFNGVDLQGDDDSIDVSGSDDIATVNGQLAIDEYGNSDEDF